MFKGAYREFVLQSAASTAPSAPPRQILLPARPLARELSWKFAQAQARLEKLTTEWESLTA